MSGASQLAPSGRSDRPRRVIWIVLPAYNEEARIGKLLDRIDEAMDDAGLSYRVVVVNDGSRDGTRRVLDDYAARMPLTVEDHPVNQGLGATIRDGLTLAAAGSGERDIVITMDADDTHTPGLILRMVRMVTEGHDVVVASRYQPGSRTIGVPWFRRLMSGGASILFRIVFPIPGVRDYTCGYRAYRADVLRRAMAEYGDRFVDQDGFQCMVDILLKLRHMNLIFGEVPFVLRYDFKEGGTKMRVLRTAWHTLGLMARRRFE